MIYIDASVFGQRLTARTGVKLVQGSCLEHALRVAHMSDDWSGLTAVARFRARGCSTAYDVALGDGGIAVVPWEAMKSAALEISLWGEDSDGVKLTSDIVSIQCSPTIDGEPGTPEPPTESIAAECIKATADAETATKAANTATTAATSAAATANTAAQTVLGTEYATAAVKALAAAQEARDAASHISGNILTGTASGDVVSVDDAWPRGLVESNVYGAYVQDGTPSPDAPAPIKTVTAVKAVADVAPRNLINGTYKGNTILGVAFTYANATTVSARGTSTGYYPQIGYTSDIDASALIGEQLTLSASIDGATNVEAYATAVIRNASNANILSVSTRGVNSRTFTMPAGARYVFANYVCEGSGKAFNATIRAKLERGATATAYVPAIGDVGSVASVATVNLQGNELAELPDGTRDEVTVYDDGTVTLTKRVQKLVLDGVTTGCMATYVEQSGTNPRFGVPNKPNACVYPKYYNVTCNRLTPNRGPVDDTPTWNTICGHAPRSAILFRLTEDIRTVADANAWLAAHPTTVYYPLAEPVTTTLPSVVPAAMVATESVVYAATDVPTTCSVTYERDMTVAYNHLAEAIASI